eukprot:888202-Pelagomonas_calceolata.AAC.1
MRSAVTFRQQLVIASSSCPESSWLQGYNWISQILYRCPLSRRTSKFMACYLQTSSEQLGPHDCLTFIAPDGCGCVRGA